MIIKDALRKGIKILKASDIETSAIEAGVILCFTIKRDKTFLYAHDDYALSEEEEKSFIEFINTRAEGKPLQYITGNQEFMSLDFKVNPHVLIPRQDTEMLVETVIEYIKKLPARDIDILDIGTGSGCIAVSLAFYISWCNATAIDISLEALNIARMNAAKAGVENRIRLIQSDLFSKLEVRNFDIIVSNPPYIPAEDIKGLQVEVREHEPIWALDGGSDGLDFYRKIIKGSIPFLKSDGLLALEIGYDQADAVCSLMVKNYYDIQVIRDLSGNDRVIVGRLLDNSFLS